MDLIFSLVQQAIRSDYLGGRIFFRLSDDGNTIDFNQLDKDWPKPRLFGETKKFAVNALALRELVESLALSAVAFDAVYVDHINIAKDMNLADQNARSCEEGMLVRIDPRQVATYPSSDGFCVFELSEPAAQFEALADAITRNGQFWWGTHANFVETCADIGVRSALAVYDDHAIRTRLFRAVM